MLPLLGDRGVVVVDVPHRDRAFTPAEAVGWLAGALEPSAPVDLIGHSLGGLLCARLAAERPELVRRLVLVAPVGAEAPGRGGLRSARAGAALVRTAAAAPLALFWAMVTDALRWGPAALVRGGLDATRERFEGAVTAPTLLVWGALDRLVPTERAQAWLKLVPGARLAVIPPAGHVPMIETPSAFVDVVLEFLDEPGDLAGMRPVDGMARVGEDDEPPVPHA